MYHQFFDFGHILRCCGSPMAEQVAVGLDYVMQQVNLDAEIPQILS